jgi:hypothetical protein
MIIIFFVSSSYIYTSKADFFQRVISHQINTARNLASTNLYENFSVVKYHGCKYPHHFCALISGVVLKQW